MLIPEAGTTCPECKAAGVEARIGLDTAAPDATPYRCEGEPAHYFAEVPEWEAVSETAPAAEAAAPTVAEPEAEPAPEPEPETEAEPIAADPVIVTATATQNPDRTLTLSVEAPPAPPPAPVQEPEEAAKEPEPTASGGELGMPDAASLAQLALWSQLDRSGHAKIPGGDVLVLVRIAESGFEAIAAEAEVQKQTPRRFLEGCIRNLGDDVTGWGDR